METLRKKTVASLFWKVLEKGGRAAVELMVQIALARLLVPEQFGVIAIALAVVNIGNVLVQSGLNTAIVQCRDAQESDYSTVFWLSLVVAAILYVVVFLLAPYLAVYLQLPDVVGPIRALSLMFFTNAALSVQVAIVQRALNMRVQFKAAIFACIISGLFGIALALIGLGIWSLVAQQLLYQVLNCAAMFHLLSWRPRLYFDFGRAKLFYSFGWKVLVAGLLDSGYQSLCDLVIGKCFASSQLGYLSQGRKYPQAIGSLLDGAIQPVALSAISRVQDDLKYVIRIMKRALRTSTFFVAPTMTLLVLVADPVVTLVLGEQWGPSIWFFRAYCIVYAILPINSSNLQVLNGLGRSDLYLKLEIIKKIYSVIIVLGSAIVFRDIHIVALGYVLSSVISMFVNAYPCSKLLDYSITEQMRDIAPSFLIAIASGIVAYQVSLIGFGPAATMLSEVAVYCFVYIMGSALFRVEAFTYICGLARARFGRN